MKPQVSLIVAFICLFSQGITAQQIYKWVDEKGKVHFSDKPVDKNAESITIKQQPRIGGENTEAGSAKSSDPNLMDKTLDAYEQRRRQKKRELAKQKAEEQRKAAHSKECENARKYLAYSKGKAQFTVNEKGERVYRSDAEIQADRKRRQAEINKYCR
jgi:hypothetical protein